MAPKVEVRPVDVNNLNQQQQQLVKKVSDYQSYLQAKLLGVSGNAAQIGLTNTSTELATIDDLAYTVFAGGHETSGKLPSPGTLKPNQEAVLNVPLTSQLSSLDIHFLIRLAITATFGPVKVSFEIDVHN